MSTRRIDRAARCRWRSAQRFEQKAPAAGAGFGRLIEPELQFDVDEARGVLGALQVAAHPVEAVGDAREHSGVALEGLDEIIARRSHEPAPDVAMDLRRGFVIESFYSDVCCFEAAFAVVFAQHPGVFAAAALRGIHDERAFAQRDARQAAGDDA